MSQLTSSNGIFRYDKNLNFIASSNTYLDVKIFLSPKFRMLNSQEILLKSFNPLYKDFTIALAECPSTLS